jgi:hypothetical protein
MKRFVVVGLSGALGLAGLISNTGSVFAGSTNVAASTNTNVNSSSGTGQSTAGSQAASTNDGNAQAITFNTNNPAIPTSTTLNNVPTVYAPGLAAAGSEVCLGSVSAGGAGAGFGVTIGGTFVDRECQLRLNARTLAVLGYARAARETMCLDADVRAAMAAAGTPCAADAYLAQQRYSEAAPTSQMAPRYSEAAPTSQTAAVNPGKSQAHAKQVAAAQPEPIQNAPTQAAADSTSGDVHPGCHREYQLIGGWYDKCSD